MPLSDAANATTAVELQKHAKNNRSWKVALKINCTPKEDNVCAYTAAVELVGFFEIDKDWDESKIEDIVAANAPAILYSSARELILLITGRGPFPPLALPAASFVDETPSARRRAEKLKTATEPSH